MKQYLIDNNLEIKGVSIRKKMHPLLCNILAIKRTLLGQHITVINNRATISETEAVIFAVTHIGKYDFEMVMESLRHFFYALSGDWELMYGTIDDYFFRANGVVYVDTEDKKDRQRTLDFNIKALKQGIPLLWCPEGIWNLSDHLPMLNLYSGIIKASLAANVDIVPIAVDQRNKEFYINIGSNIDVNSLEGDKQLALRDIMASLKWEIWEQFPVEQRINISSEYYKMFLKERIEEWPQFNMDIINHREYKDKNIISSEEAFSFQKKLKPNKNNLFLFMQDKAFDEYLMERIMK